MMSNSVLTVAAFTAIVALVRCNTLPHGFLGYGKLDLREPKVLDDHPDWLGDRHEIYAVNYREKHFQVFVHILKYVKFDQDVDTKQFLDLYKFFVKSVWNLKRETTPWGYQEKYEQVFYEEIYNQKRPENWDDICDEIEGNDREEKTKRLFLVYMKFRSHFLEQRRIEQTLKSRVEEKARRQFSLFLGLVTFAEQARVVQQEFRQFCRYVEVNLRVEYSTFKKCVFQSHCEKWENVKISGYNRIETYSPDYNLDQHHDIDNHHHEKASYQYGLFNKAQKYARMMSDNYQYDEEHDAFVDWDCDDEDDDQKHEHPFYAFLIDLHKHLSGHGPRDFWARGGHDDEKARQKFFFFALRAYKQIQEQKSLREKGIHPQEKFARFTNFLDQQENGPRSLYDFGRFQNWHRAEENQRQLSEFENFLKNMSLVKRYPQAYGDREEGRDSYLPFLALRNPQDDDEVFRDEEAMKEEYYRKMFARLRFYNLQHEKQNSW